HACTCCALLTGGSHTVEVRGKDVTVVPLPERVGGTVKRLVHVCTFLEESGAAFSRVEALRSAARAWLKERQARGTPGAHGDGGDHQRTSIEGPASFPRRSNPEEPRHGGFHPRGGQGDARRGIIPRFSMLSRSAT